MIEKKNPKEELGQGLSYHEYLIQRGIAYKVKHTQLAVESEASKNDGCTFQPKILNKKFNTVGKSKLDQLNEAMKEVKGKNGGKWQELYKMAERKKDRLNRNKDEIDFLKNPEEFTFQPNAHKYKN